MAGNGHGFLLAINAGMLKNILADSPPEKIISSYAATKLFILRTNRATGACTWSLPMPGLSYQRPALLRW
jgi:hypothetical protein